MRSYPQRSLEHKSNTYKTSSTTTSCQPNESRLRVEFIIKKHNGNHKPVVPSWEIVQWTTMHGYSEVIANFHRRELDGDDDDEDDEKFDFDGIKFRKQSCIPSDICFLIRLQPHRHTDQQKKNMHANGEFMVYVDDESVLSGIYPRSNDNNENYNELEEYRNIGRNCPCEGHDSIFFQMKLEYVTHRTRFRFMHVGSDTVIYSDNDARQIDSGVDNDNKKNKFEISKVHNSRVKNNSDDDVLIFGTCYHRLECYSFDIVESDTYHPDSVFLTDQANENESTQSGDGADHHNEQQTTAGAKFELTIDGNDKIAVGYAVPPPSSAASLNFQPKSLNIGSCSCPNSRSSLVELIINRGNINPNIPSSSSSWYTSTSSSTTTPTSPHRITTWTLQSSDQEGTTLDHSDSVINSNYYSYDTVYNYQTCQLKTQDQCYGFVVSDSTGSYMIRMDGKEVFRGGDFRHSEWIEFGSCSCDSEQEDDDTMTRFQLFVSSYTPSSRYVVYGGGGNIVAQHSGSALGEVEKNNDSPITPDAASSGPKQFSVCLPQDDCYTSVVGRENYYFMGRYSIYLDQKLYSIGGYFLGEQYTKFGDCSLSNSDRAFVIAFSTVLSLMGIFAFIGVSMWKRYQRRERRIMAAHHVAAAEARARRTNLMSGRNGPIDEAKRKKEIMDKLLSRKVQPDESTQSTDDTEVPAGNRSSKKELYSVFLRTKNGMSSNYGNVDFDTNKSDDTGDLSELKSSSQDQEQQVCRHSSTCHICLGDYTSADVVCWSPNDQCEHLFHLDCMVDWLMKHDECPLCRANYLEGTTEGEDKDGDDDVEEGDLSATVSEDRRVFEVSRRYSGSSCGLDDSVVDVEDEEEGGGVLSNDRASISPDDSNTQNDDVVSPQDPPSHDDSFTKTDVICEAKNNDEVSAGHDDDIYSGTNLPNSGCSKISHLPKDSKLQDEFLGTSAVVEGEVNDEVSLDDDDGISSEMNLPDNGDSKISHSLADAPEDSKVQEESPKASASIISTSAIVDSVKDSRGLSTSVSDKTEGFQNKERDCENSKLDISTSDSGGKCPPHDDDDDDDSNTQDDSSM